MAPIGIVGSGLAGWSVARELRRLDRATPLVMLTAERGDYYPKPALSNALAQRKAPADLVTTPAGKMAQELGVELRAQTEVQALDPGGRRVVTAAGFQPYSRLVLALGADPVRLELAGDGTHEVLSVNGLSDYARFRARLEGKRSVVILGAGLIGCEFANDLAAAGFAVTVVDPGPRPLAALLPEQAGEALRAALAGLGIAWRFGAAARAVEQTGGGLRVTLDDGSALATDVVLSAVGLRPRSALARSAGLETQRGIVVDRFLRTSIPDIHALGDCAEIEGRVLPYVAPILHAARALARTLAGEPAAVALPPMPVVVKTPAHPVAVLPPAPGGGGGGGEWRLLANGGGVKLGYFDAEQRLGGFALTGNYAAERNALLSLLGQPA